MIPHSTKMPFTPFHWGPALLIGLLMFPLLDLPALIVSSVIVDIESLYILLFQPTIPLHGFFHTYLGGSIIGIFVAVTMFSIRGYTCRIMDVFKLKQNSSFKKILFTSLFGIYFHILMDAPLYTDILPFYPSEVNPLYGMLSASIIYLSCTICFLAAFITYFYRLYRKSHLGNA